MKAAGKKLIGRMLCGMTAALILLSIVILPYAPSAQSDILLSNNPIDRELSGTVVNCMLQDSSGFLWLGTQIGLYRYNGYSLKPYRFSSSFSNEFVANFISSICEDNSKNIWVGTFGGGLFKLNPLTEEYVNFNSSSQNSDGLSDNTVIALVKDDAGKLWIGTKNKGLDCLDPVSGHFTHYEHMADNANSISANTITSICKDYAGALWIGTSGGLNKLDPQSGTFLHFKKQRAPDGIGDDTISKLYIDRAGHLWIVTGDGRLNKLDPVSEEFINFQELEGFKVTAVCEDNLGALWVGTYGNGVRMLDKDSGKFTTHGCRFSQSPSSCNYRVISLFADNSGNLWMGTEGSGIDRINTNLNFTSYRSDMHSGLRFSDDVVLSIYKDRSGMIWTGTANGGVNKFDRENDRITHYKNDPRDSGSISSNSICSIYEDSQGTLWFGAIDGTLNSLEPASGKFVRYNTNNMENSNIKDNGVLRMHEGNDGMLWACTANGGLVRLDKGTGLFTRFTKNSQTPSSISSNHVLSIAEDDAGILWIGTAEGGLNKLDPTTNRFTHYGVSEPDSAIQTLNYNVNAIVNDNGLLWLATDRGLYRFDKTSEKSVFVKDANAFIFGLLKDGKDNLWLSTPNGLIKYIIQSDTFKKYDSDGGLQKNQYTAGAYYQSADGEMFFGGTNGFSCFYADKIMENTHKPPVVITSFKIFDTPIGLNDTGEISLTYKDNFISFEFAALDYANPAKNQYAYKLEGFDSDWHYSGARNYASYNNLGGGEYILRIKASNNDGLWNEQGIQLKLVIAPPFWKATWFIIAAFVFALASIIVLIKIRTRSIRLKSLELERQVAERTKELDQANEQLRHADEMKSDFLSAVSHEIRTPLSAILGFTELITGKIEKTILPNVDLNDKKIQKAAEKISRDLNIIVSEGDRLSTLVDNLLNISKIESGKMDWRNEMLDISEMIAQSLLITKPIIEKAGLVIHMDIEADLPKVSGDKDMLTRVFINLISNAVKFTREGHIKVCARNSGDVILVSIEDTGVGIKEINLDKVFERFYKSENRIERERINGMGLGLYICKQIIEEHGGEIWVKSQLGKGSSFYFTIPHLRDTMSL